MITLFLPGSSSGCYLKVFQYRIRSAHGPLILQKGKGGRESAGNLLGPEGRIIICFFSLYLLHLCFNFKTKIFYETISYQSSNTPLGTLSLSNVIKNKSIFSILWFDLKFFFKIKSPSQSFLIQSGELGGCEFLRKVSTAFNRLQKSLIWTFLSLAIPFSLTPLVPPPHSLFFIKEASWPLLR